MAAIPPGGGSPRGNEGVKLRKAGWYVLASITPAGGRAGSLGSTQTKLSTAWLSSSQATTYPDKPPASGVFGTSATGPFPSKNSAQTAAQDAQGAGDSWFTTLSNDWDAAVRGVEHILRGGEHIVGGIASDLNPLGILGAEIERGTVASLKDLWRAIAPFIILPLGVTLIILGFVLFFKDQIGALAGVVAQVGMMVAK